MKKFFTFILCCSVIAAIHSCTKQLESSANKNSSLIPRSGVTPLILDSTTLLLTGQTWVYYEYFSNFDSVTTTLDWKTNRTSNIINLSKNQVTYNTDNTYSEIDQNGTTYNGTWQFLNNETEVQVHNSLGTFTSTIEKLTAVRYEWLANGSTYGIMVPKNQTYDTTGGRLTLLTANSWVYDEYFYNWNLTGPQLVWKPNKSNSPLNLSKNIVKYNTDGTYTETDQNGNNFSGTWQFNNNMTQVQTTNSLGTFYANIYRLDTARFEWLDSVDSHHYGEMIRH